jgi:hypothetical protein
MGNDLKTAFLERLKAQFGQIRKLEGSNSLYEVGKGLARIYIRYSKIHKRNETFYGLRAQDLKQLEGFKSLLCFLWEGQKEPLLVPFQEYEQVFREITPASDGQYKTVVYPDPEGTELYIARAGRFNVETHLGWEIINKLVNETGATIIPDLSHSQVQTLLGAIGTVKNHDIWIPPPDRSTLDWNIAGEFECRENLPSGFDAVKSILEEVDVVWINRGSNLLTALFEVEHSTPIYSGLLRFNDVYIAAPKRPSRFCIVGNDSRRELFVRQLKRPTFQSSGLGEICTFLDYPNVFEWHSRMRQSS